jgi:hypothetical protein
MNLQFGLIMNHYNPVHSSYLATSISPISYVSIHCPTIEQFSLQEERSGRHAKELPSNLGRVSNYSAWACTNNTRNRPEYLHRAYCGANALGSYTEGAPFDFRLLAVLNNIPRSLQATAGKAPSSGYIFVPIFQTRYSLKDRSRKLTIRS